MTTIGQNKKLLSLLRSYALVCVGAALVFLILWVMAATMNAGSSRWSGGETVPYWKYYEEPLVWYSIMSFSVVTSWFFTDEPNVKFGGQVDFIMKSKKFDRSCLVAFPFVGLGMVFGKGGDFVENFISLASLLAATLILLRMVMKSFYKKT